jgi:hypothetical protein
MLHRNKKVFEFHQDYLDRTYTAATDHFDLVRAGKARLTNQLWRYEMFEEQFNYMEMALKFWRPLDSWVTDNSFANPLVVSDPRKVDKPV